MSRLQRMNDALSRELTPDTLTIENESSHHHVPAGSETHVKVIAVSSKFHALNRIARHRLVHGILVDEFTTGLHALTLHLYTPQEWALQTDSVPTSPNCLDGYKHRKDPA
ncbi:MAG TPA: BolA family transcriptional regulator [Legionella sp.]|nr:BolA family transcriptional regulator [Legionella sp.]